MFNLEDCRDRKVDYYARVLQKAFQKHFNEQKILRQKEEAADIFFNKKQRREHSLNRNFHQDYIGLDTNPKLKTLVGTRNKILFAETVTQNNRGYKGVSA